MTLGVNSYFRMPPKNAQVKKYGTLFNILCRFRLQVVAFFMLFTEDGALATASWVIYFTTRAHYEFFFSTLGLTATFVCTSGSP